MLSNGTIQKQIGNRLKAVRLKRNIRQSELAESADVSLSTLKKIECGKIGSFDSLLRVIRTLGLLEIFQELVDEERMSPGEYYDFVNKLRRHKRIRATGSSGIDNKIR